MSVDCDPQSVSPFVLLGLLSTRIALADTGGLTSQTTQVIELGPAYAAALDQVDVIDDRRVQRKNSLDADAEARFSDGDRFARATVLASDHDTFECLQSFLRFGFLDAHVNAYRIARLKLRNVIPQLGLFNIIQSIHFSTLLIIAINQDDYVAFSRPLLLCANVQSRRDCRSTKRPALSCL